MRSPIDATAHIIARQPVRRQLLWVEAVICLMISVFINTLVIGIGIELM